MTLSFASERWTDPLWAHADRAAEAALRELPEAVVLVFDEDLCLVRAGGQALGRHGDAASCAPGSPLEQVLPGDVWLTIEPLLRSALAGETRSREIWTAGQRHCVLVDVGPLCEDGAAGSVSGGLVVVLEITARRQAELLEPHLHSDFDGEYERFEHTPIGAGVLDLNGNWMLVNRALCEITGYTAEELIGRPFEEIVHPEDADNDSEQRRALLDGQIPAFRVDKRLLDAAGGAGSTILSLSLVRERDGTPMHYVAQLQDVSERKRLEENLRALGDHDPLTGVRNRRLFGHDLKLQVARSRRYGEVAGLMLIELDAFADVSEYHGEQAADETLEAVARALSRRLRETDLLARVGAEQFAVLLPHIDEQGLAVLAEGVARVIAACGVDVGDELLHPCASIGFTLIDEHTLSAEQALLAADRAIQDQRQPRSGADG